MAVFDFPANFDKAFLEPNVLPSQPKNFGLVTWQQAVSVAKHLRGNSGLKVNEHIHHLRVFRSDVILDRVIPSLLPFGKETHAEKPASVNHSPPPPFEVLK